jgi:hypothetical protein
MVPPSLRRVPRNGSPASTVLWGAPTPHRPSRPASMSRGDTTVASVIRSPRPRTRCRGPGSCWFRSPHPKSTVETSGSLRFLGNPNGHCPCSSTPVGPAAFYGTKCSATDTAPAYFHDEGSGPLNFRGSIARPLAWLSTLRRASYPAPRKTRFWLLARLCQAGLTPAGFQ